MSHTLHYKASIVGALISSIAFTALAVFAIAPGATLDPVGDQNITCSGPTDASCIVNPYEGLGSDRILYLDGNGGIKTDALFTRTANSFNVSGDVSQGVVGAFNLGDFDVSSAFIPVLGASVPGVGMNISAPDFTSMAGYFSSDNFQSPIFAIASQDDSENAESVSSFVLGSNFFQTNITSTFNNTSTSLLVTSSAIGFNFENSQGKKAFGLDANGFQYVFGFDQDDAPQDYYIFPNEQGGNGQIMVNDGSGTLSWQTSAGFSPISVNNLNTLYSDGTGAGQGGPGGNNIILGNEAGVGAATAQLSNFLGFEAGKNTTGNVHNLNLLGYRAGAESTGILQSNFLGREAGFQSDTIVLSNFLGTGAGRFSANILHSNFLGAYAGLGSDGARFSNFFGYLAGAYNLDDQRGALHPANSIFIGLEAGYKNGDFSGDGGSGLDNSSDNFLKGCDINDCYSILLGNHTSTGGYENSIAIGAYATNTTSNQFMIGSSQRPINEMVINADFDGSCSVTVDYGFSCSSDENLKTNINTLSSALANIHTIQTVTYNWNNNPAGDKQIGFLAQNLQNSYPELVKEGHNGYLQVNYAGMTPILTKAIQELDLKVSILESQTTSSGGFSLASLHTVIKNFLGDIGNGIQNIFAKKIVTEELCVGNTCISESELIQVLELRNGLQSHAGTAQQSESQQQDVSDVEFDVQDDEPIDEIIEDGEEATDSSEAEDTPTEEFSDQNAIDDSDIDSENEAENTEESDAGVDE